METEAYLKHMYRTVAWYTPDGGWGAWVKVTIADTIAADQAAAAFFRRVGKSQAAHVDEEASEVVGSAMSAYFYPICEHGMSAHLCYGPDHYPREDQM